MGYPKPKTIEHTKIGGAEFHLGGEKTTDYITIPRVKRDLSEILNLSRTERGLGQRLANYIKKL